MPSDPEHRPDRPPVPRILDPKAPEDPAFDASGVRDHAESIEEARHITRRRGRELVVIVRRAVRRHLPPRSPRPPSVAPSAPRLAGRLGQVLPFLRAIPAVLAAVFAVSFLWDFPGGTVRLFGQTLALDGLLRILSVSGLIGFSTNWLAITMLFRPRAKRPIVPQGLIPAQRERVIYRLAQAISQELINEELIKQKIEASGAISRYRQQGVATLKAIVEDEEFRSDLKTLTAEYVEAVLGSESMRRQIAELVVTKIQAHAGQGISGLALKAYRALNEEDFQRRVDRAVHEIPAALDPVLDRLDDALDRVPALIEARGDDIERLATRTVLGFVERLDVHAMIIENAQQFDESQLEDLLKKTSNEQLNYIKYLGGILGVIGGFVIWEPILALAVLTALSLALWFADEALYRAAA
jgi:uncharacterized membrane protein YheB (UPF0754 family)